MSEEASHLVAPVVPAHVAANVKSDAHSAERLGVVNGLRGLAILAILYGHLIAPFTKIDVFEQSYFYIGPLSIAPTAFLTNSWMGVNLFFVLSGFVLALPYELGRRTLDGKSDIADFLIRRAKRLFPLYYFCIAMSLFLETRTPSIATGPPTAVVRLLTFTFIYYEPHFITFFDVPLWSLAVEVAFSLIFPLLLIGFRRFGTRAVTIGVFVLALAVRLYATTVRHGPPTPLEFLKDSPIARLDDFVIGMAVCQAYLKKRTARPAAVIASVCCGIALVYASAVGWDNVMLGALPYQAGALSHDFTNIGFALLLLGCLRAHASVHRVLTIAPLQLCGMMCYSLYIWHMYGIDLAGPKWGVAQLPYVCVLIFFIAAMSYRFIEFPRVPARKLFFEFPE